MPRKSDTTEGETAVPADKPGAETAAGPGAPEDAAPALSTPGEAAEPGSPDTGPARGSDAGLTPVPDAAPVDLAVDPLGPPPDEPLRPETPDPETTDPETPRREASDDTDYDARLDEPLPETAVPETAVPETAVGRPPLDSPTTPAEAAEELHDDDEGGSSLAAKLLTALVLLLLGGGLALWGAPKLAPHLPSGMSGVASWLTPGSTAAEARIAAVEAELGTRLDALDAKLTGAASVAEVDQTVAAAVDGAAARLDGEIAAMKQTLAEAGSGDLPQQLARVQSLLDGQGAELDTLKQQLSSTESSPGPVGQLGQQALERIDVYRAELDGLRAEVGTLQDRVAGLTTRVDEATQRADREIETAQARVAAIETEAETRLSVAQAETDLALIRAAVESGAPFETPLAALQGQPGVTVPQGLADAAAAGVVPMARLRDDFADSAHAAIRASMIAGAGDGVFSRTKAFFGAQVASRSLTPQPGSSPDAVLSRAEDRLRQGDLDGALAELGQLPPEAQAEMAGWLTAARLRAGAVDGLAELEASLPAATPAATTN